GRGSARRMRPTWARPFRTSDSDPRADRKTWLSREVDHAAAQTHPPSPDSPKGAGERDAREVHATTTPPGIGVPPLSSRQPIAPADDVHGARRRPFGERLRHRILREA